MKKSNAFVLFTLLSFYTFQSCQPDDELTADTLIEEEVTPTSSFEDIPQLLQPYFAKFESEAALRGFDIDLSIQNISAEISEISDDGVAGTCTYGSNHPGHIVIDQSFWNQASENLKEMVIFHELGHCSLHRGHREGAYSNGACVSIMRSGLGDCIDNYRPVTRSIYLDELFTESF